ADDSTTNFRATSTDPAGNVSPCSSPVTYVEDSTAPSAPSSLATDPAAPANENDLRVKGSAEAGSTVRVYTTGDCSGAPVASGPAAGFASPGLAVSVADDSTTTFRATATDAAGHVSPCSSPVAYVEDSTDPSAPSNLATDPAGPANDNNPRLKGSAEAGSTVRVYTTGDCSGTPVATGSTADLASPGLAMSVADDSTTTFRATATDAAGNVSPCSSEVTYRESTPVPPAQAPPAQPGPSAESPGLLAGACANPMLGTNGADRLLATPAGDRVDGLGGNDALYGFDGDDCVAGREGSDRLYGGRGDDVLRGDDGNDLLYGQEGDDTLIGGAGNDGLKGGDGTNRYFGRSGADRIYARNGVAETVDCGSGRDVAVVDPNDTVRGCERVSR
ncbi:MAG: hypothetical protein QOJ12_3475, partial [Thermoleophilales bacterium]|nr:hypothetical protein [Thermoleophilales bacterium]